MGSFETKKGPSYPKAETPDVQNVDFDGTHERRGSDLGVGGRKDIAAPGVGARSLSG